MSVVRTYSPAVRVGNWSEDLQLEEDQLKDFLERREKGQLLIQQDSNLSSTLVSKRDTSISRDGYVHYGDVVNLYCKEAKDRTVYCLDIKPREATMVAIDMSDESRLSQVLSNPCPVIGTVKCAPILRTAFAIRSVDGSPDGTRLKYGDPFQLQTMEEAGSLYLKSDKVTFQQCSKKSGHQLLNLVAESSYLTHWKVLHKNPQVRMEFEYTPVPANEPVIISHCKTNRNMTVEEKYLIRNEFGMEYELSAHTYLDAHRAEEEANVWTMQMNVPGDETAPFHVGATTEPSRPNTTSTSASQNEPAPQSAK
ncbi:cilia- and flagella-associated protein 161-like [Gigantopelta aegis]|uniref:cilia- and flagella-associated protein 161-like n=1 Tax=Gigantopelta aegis TaxID=1735272 RepID=UPI001B88D4AF|nr:cilia- and flagella-associated protein 161-like [Gigantopelta aegis]